MSYVAEPYPDVADQVLTALTGGVARETHRFAASANAFSTEIELVEPESFRVIETWIVASILYLVVCYAIAFLLRQVERRYATIR